MKIGERMCVKWEIESKKLTLFSIAGRDNPFNKTEQKLRNSGISLLFTNVEINIKSNCLKVETGACG